MKIIQLFYTKIEKEFSEELFQYYLSKLPLELQKRNSKFLRWQDRYTNLFGKILLLEALKNNGYKNTALKNLKYSKYKRPYLEGEFDFNISHSGEYIVCAIGKNIKLGIDIEKVTDIDFNHFDKTMTKDQWKEIRSSHRPNQTFFNYWAIKESIIKADGRGLSIPLLSLRIKKNNIVEYEQNKWYINNIKINTDYSSYIATNEQNIEININTIEFIDEKGLKV